MGEDRFTEAIGIFTSLASLASSIEESDKDEAFHLDEAGILYVIKYRTTIFSESNITTDEWSLIGALFSELIPARSTSFKSSMLYEIKQSDYLCNAAQCMPKIIALYASVAREIANIPEVSFSLSKDDQARILAEALLASREELYALSLSLNEHAKIENDSQRMLIVKHFGIDALDRYSAISYDELLDGISSVSVSGGAQTLSNLAISYLYGIAPYLTFAYLTDLG